MPNHVAAIDSSVPLKARTLLRGVRAPELPTRLAFATSDAETAHELVQTLRAIDARRPLLMFGRTSRELIGRSLAIDCQPQFDCVVVETSGATVSEVERLQAVAVEHRVDVVVSCGGGQVLDAGKYAAFQYGVPFVSIPTQATHDGICSPVAVIRGTADARASSHGARAPAALLVPMHVVSRAPRRTIVSGMADVAANLIALEDWRWAHRFHDEAYDDYAALLARSAAELLLGRRHMFSPDEPFTAEDVESLVHGLVLSGLAMTLAGSSRPCSGPEHLISHAFDALHLGTGTHGEQVAVGSGLAVRLYATDLTQVPDLFRNIGAPTSPMQIGIDFEDAIRALKMVHLVRPERNSRLSTAVMADPEYVIELARSAWLDSPPVRP